MEKKFFEYADVNERIHINEVTYPHCPTWGDDPEVFLVYAENRDTAFKLAMAHIYDGKPLERFYGTYKGEKYLGEVKCVM